MAMRHHPQAVTKRLGLKMRQPRPLPGLIGKHLPVQRARALAKRLNQGRLDRGGIDIIGKQSRSIDLIPQLRLSGRGLEHRLRTRGLRPGDRARPKRLECRLSKPRTLGGEGKFDLLPGHG